MSIHSHIRTSAFGSVSTQAVDVANVLVLLSLMPPKDTALIPSEMQIQMEVIKRQPFPPLSAHFTSAALSGSLLASNHPLLAA